MAIDFAITSALRADRIRATSRDASAAIVQYEDLKRSYLDTERQCMEAGFAFAPFIVEAHSGLFSAAAKRICSFIASSESSTQTANGSAATDKKAIDIMRRMQIAL